MFHRMLQTCNWEYTLLYFDGNHRLHTNSFQGHNSNWRDATATLVYPLAANKQFYARCYSNCWSNWNTGAVLPPARHACPQTRMATSPSITRSHTWFGC